jgi:hypothetical protein
MFWKFWEREKTKEGEVRFPGPKDIHQSVGSYLIVNAKKDPDWVWKLKGVVRPTEKKTTFHCRVFDEAAAAQAGVKVKDWSSLDEHLDLILWEGYFDKETHKVRPEKFAKQGAPATK